MHGHDWRCLGDLPCSGRPVVLLFVQVRRLRCLDEAWRRGSHDGTILCDLEPRRRLDLLPGRKGETLPFLNAYRTMCAAPGPELRQLLEGGREA